MNSIQKQIDLLQKSMKISTGADCKTAEDKQRYTGREYIILQSMNQIFSQNVILSICGTCRKLEERKRCTLHGAVCVCMM